MSPSEREKFSELLTDALAFYRRDVSTFALTVWWQACQPFAFEQVAKALTAHAMDAEQGRFPPMPADIVKQLAGTRTDRSLIAWGKVLDAAQRVGAYTSVCFDDGLIHAAIEDVGGWVTLCRTDIDELPFVQKRFCDSYKAYSMRPDVKYPALLAGEHDAANVLRGFGAKAPTLIGDPQKAATVYRSGSDMPKTQITHATESLVEIKRIGRAA